MTIKYLRTPLKTMTAATDTFTTGVIKGAIKSVKVITSASNTFRIFTAGDDPVEYLLGTSGAVTVAANASYYPRVIGNLATTGAALGAANNTNTYQEIYIESVVRIDVASGASDDTWQVLIIYEEA